MIKIGYTKNIGMKNLFVLVDTQKLQGTGDGLARAQSRFVHFDEDLQIMLPRS